MGKTSRYELIVIKAEEKDISDIYQIGTVSFSDAWREETIRNDMKGGHSCYFIAKIAKKVMFQGTSSHVGKSILTTAFCRILKQDGYHVAPFKAQNMALNSYVTHSGGEIGRSTVAQAEAAGENPIVQMNPVLLKPTGNSCSQVILLGKSVGNYSASEYQNKYSQEAWSSVKKSLDFMETHYDVLVIEGAGSPAEVNLKKNDIVNMRIAKECRSPVFLIADIDRGGALASIVGTLELLEPEERKLVKGLIINKFRGDITLLEPALTFLEEHTGIPVLGVIPYLDKLGIDDEDSVSLQEMPRNQIMHDVHIAIIQTPKISNFTDFDAFTHEPDVNVRFIQQGDLIGSPIMILKRLQQKVFPWLEFAAAIRCLEKRFVIHYM